MSLLDLVSNSNPIALFVLALLVLFSVVSWAIIFLKGGTLRRAQKSSAEFVDVFFKQRNLEEVFEKSRRFNKSPVARVFRRGYQEVTHLRSGDKTDSQIYATGVESVEHALKRAMMTETTELERMIPFLATVGSTSPFIGLFGTVVGIMNSFHEIGTKGSASLATVAPGIAEALIATAAGLLAAIPAVIAYNYFSARIRVLVTEMESFSSDFLSIIRRHL